LSIASAATASHVRLSHLMADLVFFVSGYEVDNINNVTGAPAAVPPVNLSNVAPQTRDELQVPESARSTLSNRSWVTDKWSDDDDDDDDVEAASNAAAAGVGSMVGAPASRVAPPVVGLDNQVPYHVAPGSVTWGFRVMPGFHHSVAVVPLPFLRSVATVAVAGENGNAGNVFPYT